MPLTRRDGDPVITARGSFVFDLNRALRDICRSLPAGTQVTVDLTAADYIDGAGPGMLIGLREHAGGTPDAVTLRGVNPTVKAILEVANFGLPCTINCPLPRRKR